MWMPWYYEQFSTGIDLNKCLNKHIADRDPVNLNPEPVNFSPDPVHFNLDPAN